MSEAQAIGNKVIRGVVLIVVIAIAAITGILLYNNFSQRYGNRIHGA